MAKERKEYQIKQEDWDKLLEFSTRARRTPVIYTPGGSENIRDVKSWADYAYDDIYSAWKAVGKEYGFDGSDIQPSNEKERKILAFPLE